MSPVSKKRRNRKRRKPVNTPEVLQLKEQRDKANAYIKVAGRMQKVGNATALSMAEHIGLQTGMPSRKDNNMNCHFKRCENEVICFLIRMCKHEHMAITLMCSEHANTRGKDTAYWETCWSCLLAIYPDADFCCNYCAPADGRILPISELNKYERFADIAMG